MSKHFVNADAINVGVGLYALDAAAEEMIHVLSSQVMGISDYTQDSNLKDTPRRIKEVWLELLAGHLQEADDELEAILRTNFPTDHSELVVVSGIHTVGVCPHHFLPVLYNIAIGYLPNAQVLGLSKLPRIAHLMSARAVLQEDLTQQLADFFEINIHASGVGVVVKGLHTCMSIRGIREESAVTTTSSMRGKFLENDKGIKTEFMQLIQNGEFPWA